MLQITYIYIHTYTNLYRYNKCIVCIDMYTLYKICKRFKYYIKILYDSNTDNIMYL